MSIYTTPLQFGYFLALAMAVLFWTRGYSEERLSDKMLGWVMILLAMEIQDYTFGFAGINFLWDQMNGFPRGTALLFGPSIYFYLRAQTNREFKLKKAHLLHLLPWFVPFLLNLIIFLNGPNAVQNWQSSKYYDLFNYFTSFLLWSSYIYYFSKSLILYKEYRQWTRNQYSDQEIISFKWFRNMLYFMIFGIAFKEFMNIIDRVYNLDFYQDWWWNLAMVGIIFYVGIWGYAQVQPNKIFFNNEDGPNDIKGKAMQTEDLQSWKHKIESLMKIQKPFLEPHLNLKMLSKKMRTNPSILSAAINQNFGKNFNDFINEYRVNEFLSISKNPEFAHYTLLALALESGFNSKSTFNRAFKKITGQTPKQINSESLK
jgi:AraC-like DNA-binding protein